MSLALFGLIAFMMLLTCSSLVCWRVKLGLVVFVVVVVVLVVSCFDCGIVLVVLCPIVM